VIEHRKSDDSIVNLTTYSYDDAGNRIGAVEHDGTVTTWTYDDSYQLTREQRSGSGSFDVSYSYDAAGNRTLQNDSGALTTYTYDAGNRLLSESSVAGVTTYTYDADGNRTQKETSAAVTYLHVGRGQPADGGRAGRRAGDVHLQRRWPAGGEGDTERHDAVRV
jgi:YD repeat-containing protein